MAGKRPGPKGKKAEEPTPEELEELELAAKREIEESLDDDRYDAMDEVVRERMNFAAGCCELGWPKWKIKDAIQTQYGVGRITAERDVYRARAKLQDEQGLSKTELRNELATFYRGVMTDDQAATREQLRAAKQLVEMLGLKDTSGYEPPTEDVEIILDEDWRSHYQNRLKGGEVLSAGANGIDVAALNGNGAKPTNGTKKEA